MVQGYCRGIVALFLLICLWGCATTLTAPASSVVPTPEEVVPAIKESVTATESVIEATVPEEAFSPVRAIWVQCNAARTAEDADKMLARVVRGGFNTLLYCVGSGTVGYRSMILERGSSVTSDYDPLAYVISQAHAQDLEVQAWWSPGLIMHYGTLRDTRPEWDLASLEEIPDDFHWTNFSIPEVRDFVGDVVEEIVVNYEVDGVHLDYIRYPEPWAGSFSDYRGAFSAEDVPATVREAYQRLKAVRPEAVLTAAVMPGYRESSDLQNWTSWLAGGYIDMVLPMAYVSPAQNAWLQDYFSEWHAKPSPERIIPGLSVVTDFDSETLKTTEQLLAQVEMCQAEGFQGIAVFDEALISDELLDILAAVSSQP